MRRADQALVLELWGDRLAVSRPLPGRQADSVTLTASLRRLVAALGRAAPEHATYRQLNWEVYQERTSRNTDRLQTLAYRLRVELKRLGLDPAAVFPPRDRLGYALKLKVVEVAPHATPTPSLGRTSSLPRVWNVPHPRNLNFAGRQDELTQLHAHLSLGRPTALVGLGGVGKTQLATAYAYRSLAEYDVVWWVRADDPAILAADYALLGSELGLPESSDPESDQAVLIRAVQGWLRQQPRWLLIFDNVREPADVRPFLAQRGGGHVLITSRHPGWRPLAQPISVPVLERDASITLLLRRTGQSDTQAADLLADLLGDLPLALAQAGAYIEARGRTLAEYVQLFETHRRELLARGLPPADYPATLATTWELALQRLAAEAPAAAALLQLLAFLAPDAIPRSLIEAGRQHVPPVLGDALADPVAFDDAIEALRRYWLLEVGDGTLSLHRLVQAATRDRLSAEQRRAWAAAAVQVVGQAFPAADDMHGWGVCGQLLPHALAAVGHVESLRAADVATAGLLGAAGHYLRLRSQLGPAQALIERACSLHEQLLGASHVETARCLNDLAFLLHAKGDLSGARQHLERVLSINTGTFGPLHPMTAASLNNLGYVVRAHGDSARAQAYFERALRIDQQVHGLDHPNTSTSLNNLAMVRKDQADLEGARQALEQALAIDQRVRGPAHRDTATTLNNLGTLLHREADLPAAADCFEQALAIWERTLGPDHLLVATALNNLGVVLQAHGELGRARACVGRALGIDERVFGVEHADVAFDLEHLAALAQATGDLAGARRAVARAVRIWQACYQPRREAAGLARLGHLAAQHGQATEAARWFALSVVVAEQAEPSASDHARLARQRLDDVCQALGYPAARRVAVLDEARRAYQADRGRALLE